MESTPGTFMPSQADAKILRELFNHYSKDSEMKFFEFFQMSLEKGLVSNKFNFAVFLDCFNSASVDEGKLPFERFSYLLTLVAKKFIPGEKKPINLLINQYLGDRTVAVEDRIEKPRHMMTEDSNKKLIYTELVKVYIEYESYFQQAFACYFQMNYNKSRIFLNWREICLQEKRISIMNFIRMLEESEISVNLISPEVISDMVAKIAPEQNPKQRQFYSERRAARYTELDQEPTGRTILEGDPGLYYYEFCIALAKIALEITKDIDEVRRSEISDQFRYFIKEMMGHDMYMILSGKAGQDPKERQINTEFYTKKFVMKMISFEKALGRNNDLTTLKLPVKMPDITNMPDAITEQVMDWIKTEPDLAPIKQIITSLHNSKDLPSLPDPPVADKSNPAPYIKRVVVVGEQIPVGKNQKAKPKPKPARKNNKEKPIKFEDMKKEEEDSKEKIFFKYKQQQEAEKHLFALENGTLSDIDVDPVLLKEIIYPAEVPSERAIMLLEACFHAYNQGRIVFALKNLEEAGEEWILNGQDLSGETGIFFCFTRGSIFESACRDDLALSNYYKCYTEGAKLTEQHPDRSLGFMGLGSVLYNSAEYDLAGRCFHKAISIREEFLGQDNPDTASAYNNYACCLIKLERKVEAYKYLALSEAIFQKELGPFHERTLTAKRNKGKGLKGGMDLAISHRPLWQFFFEDTTKPPDKKGAKGKGKK